MFHCLTYLEQFHAKKVNASTAEISIKVTEGYFCVHPVYRVAFVFQLRLQISTADTYSRRESFHVDCHVFSLWARL